MVAQLEIFQIAAQNSQSAVEIKRILEMTDVLYSKYETMPVVDSALWNENDDEFSTLLTRAEQIFDSIIYELQLRVGFTINLSLPPVDSPKEKIDAMQYKSSSNFSDGTFSDNEEESQSKRNVTLKSKRQRKSGPRPNHQPWVRKILKSWYSKNKDHAYPQPEEKAELAKKTNLSIQQVTNWFVNGKLNLTRTT
jgi:hypothetical protein